MNKNVTIQKHSAILTFLVSSQENKHDKKALLVKFVPLQLPKNNIPQLFLREFFKVVRTVIL